MTTTATTSHAFRVEYIQPFLDSLKLLFEGHLGHDLKINKPKLNETGRTDHELAGVIAFAGTASGRAVVSMPLGVAEKLAIDYTQMDPLPEGLLEDCVGELANIIVGRAKGELKDHNIVISPPTVVKGGDYTIVPQRGAACLTIPCDCKHGPVQLDISLVSDSVAG